MRAAREMREHIRKARETGEVWVQVPVDDLEKAIDQISDPKGVLSIPPRPQDPSSWFCPHCGNDRPQFTVLINTPVQMIGVGVIQTAVLVCLGKLPGKDSEGGDILCRRVMTAQIVNLQLDSALLGAARRRSPMEI